jgi:hypothetical protein
MPASNEESPATMLDSADALSELSRACSLVVENLEIIASRGFDEVHLTRDDLLSSAEDAHGQLQRLIDEMLIA